MEVTRFFAIAALAVAGGVAGVLAELLTRSFHLDPLIPFLFGTAVLCGLAFLFRRIELPEFFMRAFAFTYALFLGVAAVRSTERGLLLYSWMHGNRAEHIRAIEGLPILICLVGVGLAAAMAAVSIIAWALAQRLDRPKLDDRGSAFLSLLDERKN